MGIPAWTKWKGKMRRNALFPHKRSYLRHWDSDSLPSCNIYSVLNSVSILWPTRNSVYFSVYIHCTFWDSFHISCFTPKIPVRQQKFYIHCTALRTQSIIQLFQNM
jgi:hypothetical protein